MQQKRLVAGLRLDPLGELTAPQVPELDLRSRCMDEGMGNGMR